MANVIDHLDLNSEDGTQINLEALYQIAPSAFTEVKDSSTGKVEHKVNFDVLRQLLGDKAVDGDGEMYQFTWVGKNAARAEAAEPTTKTLRPVKEDSLYWEQTKNIYIEGDNLEVLKLLQRSYLNKVKMIYIDPPYNTGNDFVYHDDFTRTAAEEDLEAGNVDELGNRFRKNTDSNGKFHSDWCSMIYSRLLVARSLLKEDGVIFISIDDNEVENLKKICNEIFGESNFIADLIWEKKKKPSFLNLNVGTKTEYILVYAKNRISTGAFSVDVTEKGKKYPINNAGNSVQDLVFSAGSVRFNMPDGIVQPQDMSEGNIITELLTPLEIKNGRNVNEFTLRGEWRYSQTTLKEIITAGDEITISKIPFRPNHIKSGGEIKKIHNLLSISLYNISTNEDATSEQIALFGKTLFDFTKPIGLLSFLVKAFTYNDSEALIMDFFSGSATTAHSVMKLNAEDGGNRRYIMVQLPEVTDVDSEAYKAGYKNICEIGKERIRRAGKKIKEESPLTTQGLDTGFRVYRLDESNYENVALSPKEYKQDQLDLFANNIKADRNDLDLLYGSMLAWGVSLDLPMETETVDGKKVYIVNEGDLVACFDDGITDAVVQAMADKSPLRILFRDSCFARDDQKINIYEQFKQALNWTDDEAFKNIKVI
jgi:adenine-specific DNA-methyltransferase